MIAVEGLAEACLLLLELVDSLLEGIVSDVVVPPFGDGIEFERRARYCVKGLWVASDAALT